MQGIINAWNKQEKIEFILEFSIFEENNLPCILLDIKNTENIVPTLWINRKDLIRLANSIKNINKK